MSEFGARIERSASETADPSGLPDRDMVKIKGLQARADLNGLFASVLDLPIRSDGRIGVKVCASKERVWIKRENVVPASDRRAERLGTLQEIAAKHCPRTHYCIYCGSEGPIATKCAPCGFYRGTFCFPPDGYLQKGDTFMGRKLAYVKWPWQGNPDAPYVRASAAAPDAAPAPVDGPCPRAGELRL